MTNKRAPKKSSAGFAAQIRSYGKKLHLSQKDIEDYIADSWDLRGMKIPMNKSLKKDLRLYKQALY